MSAMEPTLEAIDEPERDDIEQASRMSSTQKLRAGGDLFEEARRWMLAGIRAGFPGISDEAAHQEFIRRLELSDDDGDWPVATDLALRVIRSLDQLGIPSMLVGSYSSNSYSQPRMTKGADFVLQLPNDQFARLASK